jgi:hypothetical protein
MRRIAFIGCRDWTDRDAVLAQVELWCDTKRALLERPAVVVTGDATGADQFAREAAKELGFELSVHRADWDRFGKRAGPERNSSIVADADACVAFWDGQSRGTLDCIKQFVAAGKPVRIVARQR